MKSLLQSCLGVWVQDYHLAPLTCLYNTSMGEFFVSVLFIHTEWVFLFLLYELIAYLLSPYCTTDWTLLSKRWNSYLYIILWSVCLSINWYLSTYPPIHLSITCTLQVQCPSVKLLLSPLCRTLLPPPFMERWSERKRLDLFWWQWGRRRIWSSTKLWNRDDGNRGTISEVPLKE